jgi:NhaP-type Na+/H+ or K+/H+ antiporter
VLIGWVVGFALTYAMKRCRFLSHSAIPETFLIICVAWLTYYSSELLGQSGITSLVSCALVMAHYTWYNLSPQGKHVTSVAFATLGYAAEGLVFVFIGLSLMFYTEYPFSWKFVLAELFIVIIGRYSSIVAAYYVFECFNGDKKNKLNFREVTFLTYAALIRGAIAFGLVEKLEINIFGETEADVLKRNCIVSSTMYLVLITTFIFGGFTPIV